MKIRSILAYLALACGATVTVMSAPPRIGAAAPMPPSVVVAQQADLNLVGEGEGTLSIGDRPSQTVTFVTVTSRPNQQVEISLRLADGNLQRWDGQLVSRSAGEAQIQLTNAGGADATGTLTARYQDNTLISLRGSGTLDGQPLSILFTIGDDSVSRPPATDVVILTQQGQGVFGLQGRPNQTISFSSVTVQPDDSAELSIRLAEGNTIAFAGQQTRKTAEDIVLNLTSSGNADAQGPANIRYGPNNSIVSISANGTLDGQPFFIQFSGQQATAQPPVAPPAAGTVLCTGQMQNGWRYSAEATNQRFTQIRWERSGAEPTVSTLRFYRNNDQGQPVYRGSFRAATELALVDLSGGNPRQGSQISIGVEEWGWSRGNCR
ncbi:hypothetical protein IQ273_06995 [Nodosilinea sp. LEGE 07298]|uniref:hypothetical protein n=1 Tax=Nodosilinea sp. LEGE 07298 TaxID=2777970 RepID=UPI0018820919|nr:hypothetical protein [Nodosilinea sp. LEGE 07298]MBE9109167.1 hypothetical protein [Nodosilinea sp. LEGE 07298]